ncbi:hypothetical protein DW068_06075 [Anaerobutyricum hallii]|uniref:Uncharacterized protein n=2 Tax=Anaerobutyricum hallii TaxID=39488 RepID=A0A415G8D0_9FIRM|nr:hypothetical protein DW068_06075 [Anaerobutyricum hallii]
MIMEENKFLGLEEIKNLIEKVYAAQQAGNFVNFIYGNSSISILTMVGEFNTEKEWFGQFNIFISSHEEQKANYDKCIAHLEILAGEEHDN